eukprot:NODE_8597_length_240_cov_82.895288_g7982_i0.p2 GENE.NODE_8597_length_240_cov_82.895288_g7982_i0~~NODE_8597_length_240_cov_82.895288_g7982_i0.p2  ORF type:complete len:50 (+),score=24.30 NODE_8597_length_240_cov_82.895288_g7982_i0:27-152(+)
MGAIMCFSGIYNFTCLRCCRSRPPPVQKEVKECKEVAVDKV